MTETVKEISLDEYQRCFEPPTVFDSAAFIRLNAHKVSRVAVVSGHGLALPIGYDADSGLWRAPFSAPFAMPAGGGDYAAFAHDLLSFCEGRVQLVTPPPFHVGVPEWINVLDNEELTRVDNYSYHYPLERLDSMKSYMSTNMRRNYNSAMRQGFSLRLTNDVDAVYNFIANHHKQLGYHMAMTLQQVRDTTQVADIDFFECVLDGQVVGAAFFYHVAPGVTQLINWGDALDMRDKHITAFLLYSIFEHYRSRGILIVDLGPASVDGVKNEGLVRFKLSAGCIETVKPTFIGS